jgi:hypothetical protein
MLLRLDRARVVLALALVVALAVAVAGCSDDGDGGAATPDATSTTSTPQPDGGSTTSTMVQPVGDPVPRTGLFIGDCFNAYDEIDVTTRVPCDAPHDGEVFHFENHPAPYGDPYPNGAELEEYALRVCYAWFEPFTGGLYEVSRLEIGVVTPTEPQWTDSRARYRGITCYVHDPAGGPLVGSMRGRGE